MSKEVFVFEVSEKSFGQSVLLNSRKLPVLVEFMGVWSEPCVVMADMLAGLAKEFAEQFIFARVDIDENPALREEYKIENLPTLVVFRNGEAVRTEIGQLQETEARALLKDFGVFRESDEIREQARAKHMAGKTPEAITLLAGAVKKDPTNTRIAMDMVQIFIDIGELEEAKKLFERLPSHDRESDMGKALSGQLLFLDLAAKTDGEQALLQRIATNPDDHDAYFDLALCQVASHHYDQAMDNLFYIQEHDAGYKDGAAREMIATLVNMLKPAHPQLARDYRRRLSNMLSS
ncbi:MAG: tetratricopeptide repeat protein [Granulosicoccaceae bacterium]|jgi:putative thioredoxin